MKYISILLEHALANKYTEWYCNIVMLAQARASNRADAKKRVGYVEEHHILPKSFGLGGIKDKENYAYLTAREHFVCHRLLAKMFSGKFKVKMNFALYSMRLTVKRNKQLTLTSRDYEVMKKAYSYARKNSVGPRLGSHPIPWNKGLKTGHTPWNKGVSGYTFGEEASHNHRIAYQKFKNENPEKWAENYKNLKIAGEGARLMAIQKKTIVYGIVYASATIAAIELGVKKTTLIKRVLSKNYPDYMYLGENK